MSGCEQDNLAVDDCLAMENCNYYGEPPETREEVYPPTEPEAGHPDTGGDTEDGEEPPYSPPVERGPGDSLEGDELDDVEEERPDDEQPERDPCLEVSWDLPKERVNGEPLAPEEIQNVLVLWWDERDNRPDVREAIETGGNVVFLDYYVVKVDCTELPVSNPENYIWGVAVMDTNGLLSSIGEEEDDDEEDAGPREEAGP